MQHHSERSRRNRELRAERLAAAKAIGTHSKSEWEALKISCGNMCVICKGRSGLLHVEKDHILPIYLGGSDSIENIQPVCARCNAAKGPDCLDYRPEGWRDAYALL